MKKILIIIILILLVAFFYPKPYISSPGFTTPQMAEEFNRTAKKCIGFSYLTNASEMVADAPGESLCFGWLK
jgi:hypothetical protein